ncbi:MAG: hypothetical protein A4E28_01459 [Methanocella sp. PtaU1.Bin125]|nr:MAG: hypothetical protein A4E28_01459 [Methanocella sp. PtaU1.Bin125]
MSTSGVDIGNSRPGTEIPGLRAIYFSEGEDSRTVPDEVTQAVRMCRALNADVIALESSDRTVVAAVNGYDDTYAAAVYGPGVALPAIARGLQGRLYGHPMPDIRPDILPAAIVRKAIRRWERRIALIFGEPYAAGLVAAVSPAKSPEAVTIEDLETIRRKLSAALGDCIDLPAAETC